MLTSSAHDDLSVLRDHGLISQKELASLQAAGLVCVLDLLERFPRRYEDRRRFDHFPAQAGGEPVCLRAVVVDSTVRRFGGTRRSDEVLVESEGAGVFENAKLRCRWFNMPYVTKVLAAGHEIVLYGRVKEQAGSLIMDHPEFEIIAEDSRESVHLERVVPVYRNISGIAQRRLREIIFQILAEVDEASLLWLYTIDMSYPRAEAFREIHFPGELEQAEAARRYFALEEFFLIQLKVVWRRNQSKQQKGQIQGLESHLVEAFYAALPFKLTGAQQRSIKEIHADMLSGQPMQRLLQGDVGSGKTFVALVAALYAVGSGNQVALMAPTQILAEQHYQTFSHWLTPLGVQVILVTSARKESSMLELENSSESDAQSHSRAQVIVGTHALLYDDSLFSRLGLVIVDEQHKFGVEQRNRLIGMGEVPDVLAMTATPIPRTLTQTIYGDMDVSVIDAFPAGRGKIITGVRVKPKVSDVTRFIKDNLEKGRQAYIVYPLVEESESLSVGSAVVEVEKWRKRFSKYEVGLLHGKLAADQKEAVMESFRSGKVDVLVATSVVEVGVDVPNANIMIIYGAERFGLAQLHQLRGRIGRGEHKSYCVLVTEKKESEGADKLDVLAGTRDGFQIAEADLEMRGPGEVLGTQQSGLSHLKFPEFLASPDLVREARGLAQDLLQKDPKLLSYPDLAAQMSSGE